MPSGTEDSSPKRVRAIFVEEATEIVVVTVYTYFF
jgi:hypothetical protein